MACFEGSVKIFDLDMNLIKTLCDTGQEQPINDIEYDPIKKLLYCNEFGSVKIRIYDIKKNYRRHIIDFEVGIQNQLMLLDNFLIMGGNKHI